MLPYFNSGKMFELIVILNTFCLRATREPIKLQHKNTKYYNTLRTVRVVRRSTSSLLGDFRVQTMVARIRAPMGSPGALTCFHRVPTY